MIGKASGMLTFLRYVRVGADALAFFAFSSAVSGLVVGEARALPDTFAKVSGVLEVVPAVPLGLAFTYRVIVSKENLQRAFGRTFLACAVGATISASLSCSSPSMSIASSSPSTPDRTALRSAGSARIARIICERSVSRYRTKTGLQDVWTHIKRGRYGSVGLGRAALGAGRHSGRRLACSLFGWLKSVHQRSTHQDYASDDTHLGLGGAACARFGAHDVRTSRMGERREGTKRTRRS